MVLIGGILVVLAAAGILFKTQFGVLIRGFWGLFVKDLASTPEGAAAVYDQLIDKAQDDYNRASDNVQQIAGKLESAKRDLNNSNESLRQIEKQGEVLAKAGNIDDLQVLATERNSIIAQVGVYKEGIDRFEPLLADALQIKNSIEAKLRQLKNDKVNKISQLKIDRQTKEMYDSLDEMKRNNNLDKLAGAVDDKMKEAREKAIGAKVVHDSNLSTKVNTATSNAAKLQNDSWVESLTQKHQTRPVRQINQDK